MRIAVNIECLEKEDWNNVASYANELMQNIIQVHAQHEFLFFSDKPATLFSIGKQIIILTPVIKGNASLKYWYDFKLAAAVKKFKADVLINFGDVCSLATKIPQVLLAKDLAVIHYPKWFSKSEAWFYKVFQKKIIAKAKHIVTFSEFVKLEINAQYKASPEKITVVQPAVNKIFNPISFKEREATKDGFADGREYFLFVGGSAKRYNLMNVLKAFSSFKKWQQSSMKLLIAGSIEEEFVGKLKTYKHREDIEMLGNLSTDQYAKLVAAAYAFVHVPIYDSIGFSIIEAMQSGVPAIASNNADLPEIAADAALYVNPNEVDEIANQMKILYRDETLRSQLIQNGLVQSAKFSLNDSAEKLMKIIEVAASK